MIRNGTLFDPAKKMLRWAQRSIDDFDSAVSAYIATDPCRDVTEHDLQTRENVLKIVRDGEVPEELEELALRAITNIKHTFDRALYAACAVLGETPSGEQSVNFLWADTLNGAKGIIQSSKSKVPTELRSVVLGIEPYGTGAGYIGGDNVSRQMAKIANRKHTVDLTVVPTYKMAQAGVTLVDPTLEEAAHMHQIWRKTEDGIEMARFPDTMRYYYNYSFNLLVCFDELEPLEGMPATKALSHFAAKAQTTLKNLERASLSLRQ